MVGTVAIDVVITLLGSLLGTRMKLEPAEVDMLSPCESQLYQLAGARERIEIEDEAGRRAWTNALFS